MTQEKTLRNADAKENEAPALVRWAACIAGADALVAWGSWLIDEGSRGEMESRVAKTQTCGSVFAPHREKAAVERKHWARIRLCHCNFREGNGMENLKNCS